jgi:hypothetical protein
MKFRVFWDAGLCSTSETSVNFNVTTRRYIPEGSKLHTEKMLMGLRTKHPEEENG